MQFVDIERHERGIARVVMKHRGRATPWARTCGARCCRRLTELLNDPRTRVIIIASALKNFSVGGDLSKMDTLSNPEDGRQRIVSAHRLARLLLQCRQAA